MNGKIVGGAIVMIALTAGAVMYYLQEYAFYSPVSLTPGHEIKLTPIIGATPEVIISDNFEAIDAESSPLRFRACFTTPLSQAMLTETYRVYDKAVPLTGPRWFGCYNAETIGDAIETGEAIAFLSEPEIAPGVDRVIAVFPDGRAYAWHQLNDTYKD